MSKKIKEDTKLMVKGFEIWKRENEEARKKLEALENEIVATKKRVVISQEQIDIADEDWNLFFNKNHKQVEWSPDYRCDVPRTCTPLSHFYL